MSTVPNRIPSIHGVDGFWWTAAPRNWKCLKTRRGIKDLSRSKLFGLGWLQFKAGMGKEKSDLKHQMWKCNDFEVCSSSLEAEEITKFGVTCDEFRFPRVLQTSMTCQSSPSQGWGWGEWECWQQRCAGENWCLHLLLTEAFFKNRWPKDRPCDVEVDFTFWRCCFPALKDVFVGPKQETLLMCP